MLNLIHEALITSDSLAMFIFEDFLFSFTCLFYYIIIFPANIIFSVQKHTLTIQYHNTCFA